MLFCCFQTSSAIQRNRGEVNNILATHSNEEAVMASAVKMDLRKDLLQTSTGVGHHFRTGYYFPSSNFKVCRRILSDNLYSIMRLVEFVASSSSTADVFNFKFNVHTVSSDSTHCVCVTLTQSHTTVKLMTGCNV